MITIKFLLLLSSYFASSISQDEMCGFDDNLITKQKVGDFGDYAAFETNKLSTQWNDHQNKIPYRFARNVPAVDRQLIRNQMDNIEMNSCIQFREMGKQEKIRHSLKIQVDDPHINYGGCTGRVGAGYKQKRKVIL